MAAGRHGVLAAGQGSPGVLGASSASLSSTVSELSCRERSTDVGSRMEDSSASGAGGGPALWRVTPSSPLMVSTRRAQDRPKYVREMTFPGKMMFPTGKDRQENQIYQSIKVPINM